METAPSSPDWLKGSVCACSRRRPLVFLLRPLVRGCPDVGVGQVVGLLVRQLVGQASRSRGGDPVAAYNHSADHARRCLGGWKASQMTWTLPEPMLTDAVRSPALPASSAAEPKWGGFRATLSVNNGQVVLRSRRGTQTPPAFPEVVAGAAQLPDATALDGVM